jgi:hypothetical protein
MEILRKVSWKQVFLLGAIIAVTALTPQTAFAHEIDIGHKFDPIIDVMKQLARPVAQGSFIYAGIQYCLGQKNKAGSIVKGTVMGYLFIQWSPMLMDIIDEVGRIS